MLSERVVNKQILRGACLVIRERILPGKDVFCDFILAEHSL